MSDRKSHPPEQAMSTNRNSDNQKPSDAKKSTTPTHAQQEYEAQS